MKLDAFRSVVAAAATGEEPSKEQALEAANEVIAVVESIATSLARIADAVERPSETVRVGDVSRTVIG